jgi:hypothetical protein
MTDYLPAPPAEIHIDPAYELWQSQNGGQHKFAYAIPNSGDTFYGMASVNDFCYLRELNVKRDRMIADLEHLLKDNLGQGDDDLIQTIADTFDISLEKEWEFSITVTFTGTFTAPANVDPEDVLDNFTFEMNEGYYQPDGVSINDSDYNVESHDSTEA